MHIKTYIYIFVFTYNSWSYLLWSPVILCILVLRTYERRLFLGKGGGGFRGTIKIDDEIRDWGDDSFNLVSEFYPQESYPCGT